MSRDQNAYDKAIALLKLRPHYSVELARKLSLRHFKREEIQEVIRKLTEQGLLNDEQYAQAYLDELIRRKPYGFYMLLKKMLSRGIGKAEAQQLLAERFELAAEEANARRVLDRERGGDKMKLAQKLSRQGFRSEAIRRVIDSTSLPDA